MPAEIVGPPLALRTKFPNGGATHKFGGLPLPHLVRDLLEGVVVLCSANGTVKSRWTVFTMTANLRSAIRSLHALGFTGGIADLRAEHLLAVCANLASTSSGSGPPTPQTRRLVWSAMRRRAIYSRTCDGWSGWSVPPSR